MSTPPEISKILFQLSISSPYVKFCWDYLFIHEAAPFRDILAASKSDDFWPIKTSLDTLKRMGLVEERGEVWALTSEGKKVRDVQAVIRPLAVV